jgi:hypothetical protein
MTLSDEKLMKISYEIDEFLINQAVTNNVSLLSLSGIMMARLVRLSEEANCESDFYDLVQTVSEKEHLREKSRTMQ